MSILVPGEVQIGPLRWVIELRPGMKKLGVTLQRETNIAVSAAQSEESQRETLFHELLHAVLYTSGTSVALDLTTDAEERLVRLLSPWLLQMLRDNPALVGTLTDGVLP